MCYLIQDSENLDFTESKECSVSLGNVARGIESDNFDLSGTLALDNNQSDGVSSNVSHSAPGVKVISSEVALSPAMTQNAESATQNSSRKDSFSREIPQIVTEAESDVIKQVGKVPIHTSSNQSALTFEFYEDEEYEDKPIKNTGSIESERPVPVSKLSSSASTEIIATLKAESREGGRLSLEDRAFAVETRSSTSVAPGVGSQEEYKIPDVNEFQVKGLKYEFFADPSPCLIGSDAGRLTFAEPVSRNQRGDEVCRNGKLENEQDSKEFRSELRVSTAFSKWSAAGVSTVLDGVRVGSTVSVFGLGEAGLVFCSMFEDDGLQPMHVQRPSSLHTAQNADNLNNRCGDEIRLCKAIPDPVPDFDQPPEVPHQLVSKDTSIVQMELPSRKTKGTAEKRRENRIEMICLPLDHCTDEDVAIGGDRVQDIGLPQAMWKQEEYRGGKFDAFRESELQREASESRVIEKARRIKGIAEGHIETLSMENKGSFIYRGHAFESDKVRGETANDYHANEREACMDYAEKHVEWIYDEYLRPGDGPKISSSNSTHHEIVEMKFDVALSSDEDRISFANAQRAAFAKLLGIPEQFIQILGVKPGSPVTLVRFQINGSDVPMIPVAPDNNLPISQQEISFNPSAPMLGISILQAADEDGHRQFSSRLKDIFGEKIVLEDRTSYLSTESGDDPIYAKAYGREQGNELRKQIDVRTKGESISAVPGTKVEDEPHQLVTASGEYKSTPSSILKYKGSTFNIDSDVVERVFKPGRDMMQEDQFSSAKVQRRPPRPPKRLTDVPSASENDLDEQVKVQYEEVDNTRRLKEQEDELNFLPAQRAALASRTTIMAKKDEGMEDCRFDFLREHDHKKEEKQKEAASLQPSLKLTKAVEEIQYELAQKITGSEDPRTEIACEPSGLSLGDKRSKRKGKDFQKLSVAAVPEAYMAFGIEKDSQRLAPSIVTLEKAVSNEKKGASTSNKLSDEMLSGLAPTIIQMKFDAAFVDQESRQTFAEAQRVKLAKLLRVPLSAICVRVASPGSPLTIVTFEVTPDSAEEFSDGSEPVFSNRPFDCSVVEVEVISSFDEEAELLMKRMRSFLGPKIPIMRQSAVFSKSATLMKEKNVKFDTALDSNVQPAYTMSRAELQAKAMQRQKGALTSEKEAVEVNLDGEGKNAEQGVGESALEGNQPIVSFDRRLPKSAKNKQHLLSRIHTIESTLQRLYGKLEVDSELPDIESIEQIMSNTIKQAVYSQDAGLVEDGKFVREGSGHADYVNGAKAHTPSVMITDQEDHEVSSGVDEVEKGEDLERRNQLRAERRKRMEERERIRSEKQSLDRKPTTSGTVRFDVGPDPSSNRSISVKESLATSGEASLQRLKELQDDDTLTLYPANIPSVPVHQDIEEEFADVSKKKLDALKVVASTTDIQLEKDRGLKSNRSEGVDEPIDAYELQQMAAGGTDGWKAAFSKVRHGKRTDLLAMLDAGCPCDLKDEAGNSLLNIAAQNGHKSIIKALLRRGASINTQNHKGQTPLHFCFTYGFSDLGNYLISKGADDTVQNVAGLTCYEGLGD